MNPFLIPCFAFDWNRNICGFVCSWNSGSCCWRSQTYLKNKKDQLTSLNLFTAPCAALQRSVQNFKQQNKCASTRIYCGKLAWKLGYSFGCGSYFEVLGILWALLDFIMELDELVLLIYFILFKLLMPSVLAVDVFGVDPSRGLWQLLLEASFPKSFILMGFFAKPFVYILIFKDFSPP